MTQVIEHEGVKYRKVEREAVLGDKVIVVKAVGAYPSIRLGNVLDVLSISASDVGIDVPVDAEIEGDDKAFLYHEEYAVLEPLPHAMPKLTDAEPGDTVRIVDAEDITDEGYKNGDTFVVDHVWDSREGAEVLDESGEDSFALFAEEFEVVREKPTLFDELTASLEQAAQIAEQHAADQPYDAQAERIADACADLSTLLIRKNHDYGDSFAKQYEKYGMISALIRMDDKMRRLETLVDGNAAQVGESIEDTLIDLAGYALLAAVELRKTMP